MVNTGQQEQPFTVETAVSANEVEVQKAKGPSAYKQKDTMQGRQDGTRQGLGLGQVPAGNTQGQTAEIARSLVEGGQQAMDQLGMAVQNGSISAQVANESVTLAQNQGMV